MEGDDMNDPDFIYDDIKDRALIDREPAALKIWNAAEARVKERKARKDVDRRLDEIRARCDVAVAGPWAWRTKDNEKAQAGSSFYPKDLVTGAEPYIDNYDDGPPILMGAGIILNAARCVCDLSIEIEDASFIAHSRDDVPWLLEMVDKMLAERRGIKSDE